MNKKLNYLNLIKIKSKKGKESPLSQQSMTKVEDRFLKYIKIHTTSDEESATCPSSKRQFDLANILKDELTELGLSDILLDDNCYLYARLKATQGLENVKPIGFISHMDTAPDYNGKNVNPIIHNSYDGNDVLLPASGSYLKVSDFPHLKNLIGKTLITTDGSSLLGADDKAGIAEIITAIEKLKNSDIPHGDIWIGFTPDEEIGQGALHFNLDYFKANYAYTVDGDYEGEVAYENFNAASAEFSILGKNVHPGEAYGIMKNAALIASELAASLPADQTPATTKDRQGFFHLTDMKGDVASASLSYIVRDHDKDLFNQKLDYLATVKEAFNRKYGEETVTLTIKHSYSNMLEVIEKNLFPVELAKEAISSVGLKPLSRPVRGGTDGANLSFMGLPCPNLGTGGYGFHGPYEHITVEAMNTVVDILVYIASHG